MKFIESSLSTWQLIKVSLMILLGEMISFAIRKRKKNSISNWQYWLSKYIWVWWCIYYIKFFPILHSFNKIYEIIHLNNKVIVLVLMYCYLHYHLKHIQTNYLKNLSPLLLCSVLVLSSCFPRPLIIAWYLPLLCNLNALLSKPNSLSLFNTVYSLVLFLFFTISEIIQYSSSFWLVLLNKMTSNSTHIIGTAWFHLFINEV